MAKGYRDQLFPRDAYRLTFDRLLEKLPEEPFSGSGTTIIAAETTGRTCLAVEIDPAYVDVALRRWQAFAGGTRSSKAMAPA